MDETNKKETLPAEIRLDTDLTQKSFEEQAAFLKHELPDDKRYHMYMSYSEEDINLVRSLVTDLERNYSLSCYFFERDRIRSATIAQNILKAISESIATVICFTPKYLLSDRYMFDFNYALYWSLEGNGCLITVMLEHCQNIPDTMKPIPFIDGRNLFDVPRKIIAFLYKNYSIYRLNAKKKQMHPEGIICGSHIEILQNQFDNQTISMKKEKSLPFVGLPKGKKYHMYMSHGSDDIDLIIPLVAHLEDKFHIKCAFMERDGMIGERITQNIADFTKESIQTVICLTPSYVESPWCNFVCQLALHKSFEEGQNCVIPLMLKPCDRIPDVLTAFVYIDVKDTDFPQKLVSCLHNNIPREIVEMGDVRLYEEALRDGKISVFDSRAMIVGPQGVGKTTLTRRLLHKEVDVNIRKKTNSIDTHVCKCVCTIPDGQWIVNNDSVANATCIESKLGNALVEFKKVVKSPNFERSNARMTEPDIASTSDEHSFDQYDVPKHEQQHKREIEKGTSEILSKEQHFEEVANFMKSGNFDKNKRFGEVSLWDFGGHYVFYTTHQTYLTYRAVYLVVLDLTKDLDDCVEEEDRIFLDIHVFKQFTYKDFLILWLNAIHTFARDAPVIFVATHLDEFHGNIDIFFEDVKTKLIRESESLSWIRDTECFGVDNSIQDPAIEHIQHAVIKAAQKQSYWGEQIPAKWVLFEHKLNNMEQKVMTVKEITEIDDGDDVSLSGLSEIRLFLKFQHRLGKLVYLEKEDMLNDLVILDPKWLIRAFRCIVTREEFISDPLGRVHFRDITTKAQLTQTALEAAWGNSSEKFYEHKEQLLEVMLKLGIIAQPSVSDVETKTCQPEKIPYFLLPSMFRSKVPDDYVKSLLIKKYKSTILVYQFEKHLSALIFNRLLSHCINQWPVSSVDQQFCGLGVFDLDNEDCQKLIIAIKDDIIQLQILSDSAFQETDLSREIRKFVESMLRKVLNISEKENSRISHFIKCTREDFFSTLKCIAEIDLISSSLYYCSDEKTFMHVHPPDEISKYWLCKEEVMKEVKPESREYVKVVCAMIHDRYADLEPEIFPVINMNTTEEKVEILLLSTKITSNNVTIIEGFKVNVRNPKNVDKEALVVIQSEEMKSKKFTQEEMNTLETAIEQYGPRLFQNHKNLNIISISPVRSRNGGQNIESEACIVLYCFHKGLRPMNESNFPTSLEINGTAKPVDVREGFFMFCPEYDTYASSNYHERIKMGCYVGINTGSGGTVGPFVNVNGDRAFITCAHVTREVDTHAFSYDSQQSHEIYEALQPSFSTNVPPSERNKNRRCGSVTKAVFKPQMGSQLETSIDAAIVKIDAQRQPDGGKFAIIDKDNLKDIDLTEYPLYESGSILKVDDIRPNTWVVKFGMKTHATKGSVNTRGGIVRDCQAHLQTHTCTDIIHMVKQIEIGSITTSPVFFQAGDSGSGVFGVEEVRVNNQYVHNLHLIGLGIGLSSYNSAVVTPIEPVLQSLGLNFDSLKF